MAYFRVFVSITNYNVSYYRSGCVAFHKLMYSRWSVFDKFEVTRYVRAYYDQSPHYMRMGAD
jgi:hypothetical protein